MTNLSSRIHAIYRYPVKGLSPEPLPSTVLLVGKTVIADRLYAIENGPSGFDPAAPAYFPKLRFLMLMRNGRLAGLDTRFNEANNVLTIHNDSHEVARGDLQTAEGRETIEAFFAAFCTDELRGPPKFSMRQTTAFRMTQRKSYRSSISPRSPQSRPPSACLSIHCDFAPTFTSMAGRPGMSSSCSIATSRWAITRD